MSKLLPTNFSSASPRATTLFAASLASSLRPGQILALRGPLGSGKTTFVKGLARGLGIRGKITSPSFVVAVPYRVGRRGIKNFYHLDLYRLRSPHELRSLGFEEIIADRQNVVAIEWPEIARRQLPRRAAYYNFQIGRQPHERKIRLWSKK